MQTHNILTELNEAQGPGQLRCWSQDWPGLHLDDSQHSDILRSSARRNNVSQLKPNCGESFFKDWVI